MEFESLLINAQKKQADKRLVFLWRRRRDSNSRTSFPAYSLSRGAPSTYLGTSPYLLNYRNLRELRAPCCWLKKVGGEGGIRTHGSFESLVFKTSSLNRSDTSPHHNEAYYSTNLLQCQVNLRLKFDLALNLWYRWSGSNRHGIATTGFWVRHVCQFHHTGMWTDILYYNIKQKSSVIYKKISFLQKNIKHCQKQYTTDAKKTTYNCGYEIYGNLKSTLRKESVY